jgi:hypothetical protein
MRLILVYEQVPETAQRVTDTLSVSWMTSRVLAGLKSSDLIVDGGRPCHILALRMGGVSVLLHWLIKWAFFSAVLFIQLPRMHGIQMTRNDRPSSKSLELSEACAVICGTYKGPRWLWLLIGCGTSSL